jgi:RyR domain
MNTEQIAMVCHEANRAYCAALGDDSLLPWAEAPQWQRESIMAGVEFLRAHPDAPLRAGHEQWLTRKAAEGWRYGPRKDIEKKMHPCFLSYERLPRELQAKDALFQAIVRVLISEL